MVQDLRIKQINKDLGFTLVELLVSISIIAILSAVLVISYSNAQKNSRDQRRIADLKAVQNAAEQMMLLSGTYPTTNSRYLITSPSWTVGGQVVLSKVPGDPKGGNYATNGISATAYCVCASMEVAKNSNAENAQCSFVNPQGYFCVKNQQ